MKNARTDILTKIKSTRSAPDAVTNELGSMRARLQDHPVNLIPERGKRDSAAQVGQFIEEAERVHATVKQITSETDIPTEIARYLAEHNLASRIKQAPSLSHIDWSHTLLDVSEGVGHEDDEVCVTKAFGGVAETGTLVTYSGPENPTTLNFLPPVHIAVLNVSDIEGSYEDVWAKLRTKLKDKDQSINFIPRTVNFITGPSRTGDIQQTLLLGIHGPQRLHIVLVDEDAS